MTCKRRPNYLAVQRSREAKRRSRTSQVWYQQPTPTYPTTHSRSHVHSLRLVSGTVWRNSCESARAVQPSSAAGRWRCTATIWSGRLRGFIRKERPTPSRSCENRLAAHKCSARLRSTGAKGTWAARLSGSRNGSTRLASHVGGKRRLRWDTAPTRESSSSRREPSRPSGCLRWHKSGPAGAVALAVV